MKRSVILSIIAVVALSSLSFSFPTSCIGASSDKKVVIREACAYSETDQIGGGLKKLAERFNARVGGKYELQAHTGGTLVAFHETLDAVRVRSVELGLWPVGPFSMSDRAFATSELPFMFNNVEANVAACKPLVPLYGSIAEKKFNQKILSIFTATSLDLLSKRPVKTMEDWKGLLIQAIAPACGAVAKSLGGSAVSIPWPDAYSSLDKGVVDGGLYATNQMVMYKLYEVAKYLVPVYMVPTFVACSVNLDVWNKMPKNIQDILVEEHVKYADSLNELWTELVHSHPKKLADHGVNVYYLPKAERDKWRAACQPYVDEELSKIPAGFVTEFKKIADQANTKYPYIDY